MKTIIILQENETVKTLCSLSSLVGFSGGNSSTLDSVSRKSRSWSEDVDVQNLMSLVFCFWKCNDSLCVVVGREENWTEPRCWLSSSPHPSCLSSIISDSHSEQWPPPSVCLMFISFLYFLTYFTGTRDKNQWCNLTLLTPSLDHSQTYTV